MPKSKSRPWYQKKFNGKIYHHSTTVSTKKEAKQLAREIKEDFPLTRYRIVKMKKPKGGYKKGYSIYLNSDKRRKR
jgi:hypothetical protein